MQASGHRFDPDRLHQFFGDDIQIDEDTKSGRMAPGPRDYSRIFDIVNGFFKIDAVMHWLAGKLSVGQCKTKINLAEKITHNIIDC